MFRINRKTILFFMIACWFLIIGSTQILAGPGSQTLWKISKDGNFSYILGSVHFLKKENYPLPQKIYAAFDECDALVLEADLDSLKMPETASKMMHISMLPDNRLFKDVVSQETFEQVSSHLAGLGLNIQLMPRSKPWFLALTITALEAQKMGMDATLGLDNHFAQKANEKEYPILGLETIAFQMGLFDNLPIKTQISFLLKTLDDAKDAEVTMGKMLAAWENGEEGKLQELLSGGFEGFPELYNKLLIARNENWVPQIEKLILSDKKYFIVVGAGHLVGKKGVIELLKKRGYSIKRI